MIVHIELTTEVSPSLPETPESLVWVAQEVVGVLDGHEFFNEEGIDLKVSRMLVDGHVVPVPDRADDISDWE